MMSPEIQKLSHKSEAAQTLYKKKLPSKIETIQSKDMDTSLKLIYGWVQKKSISYDEFEDLLAEVFYTVIKNIK